jgi:F-type H+-transporting ATPase subunit b
MNFILDTLGKVGFDWRMGLFNLINFFLVLWILKKFLFAPIVETITERQKKMTKGMENFTQSKSALQMAEQKAQGIIDDAKVERNKVLAQAQENAKASGVELKEKAKNEIDVLVQQAKKNIAIDKEEMREVLKKETLELVVLATEKILNEKMDDKKDETYIKNVLRSMK